MKPCRSTTGKRRTGGKFCTRWPVRHRAPLAAHHQAVVAAHQLPEPSTRPSDKGARRGGGTSPPAPPAGHRARGVGTQAVRRTPWPSGLPRPARTARAGHTMFFDAFRAPDGSAIRSYHGAISAIIVKKKQINGSNHDPRSSGIHPRHRHVAQTHRQRRAAGGRARGRDSVAERLGVSRTPVRWPSGARTRRPAGPQRQRPGGAAFRPPTRAAVEVRGALEGWAAARQLAERGLRRRAHGAARMPG